MIIIHGRKRVPARRVIYGPPGVGKSTFACAEPGALAIDYEDGLDCIGVDRVKGATNWVDSLSLLREACEGAGSHRAVVVDTLDRLEDQAAAHICGVEGVDGKKKKSLADYGYNDGYKALASKWRELLFVLESARAHGRAVTLVAHVQRSSVKDPQIGDHGKFIAAIHKDCWSPTHRWADCVLFANYEQGVDGQRAVMTGLRLLHTQAATGFDAKHRPNLTGDSDLPIPGTYRLSWDAYSAAVETSFRSAEDILLSIAKLVTPETADRAKEFIEKANGDPLRLAKVETALMQKVGMT